jgi:CheY-like chemotaxis protein
MKKQTENNLNIKPINVLIIEDDDASVYFLTTILKPYSEQILTSHSGTEAVEICRNNPDLDLILMDIKLPGIDGYETTRKIRSFNKNIIIIAQTAYGLLGDREKSLEAGCNDYISKPTKALVLLQLIKKHIQS